MDSVALAKNVPEQALGGGIWHFGCSGTAMSKTYSHPIPFVVRFAGVFGKVWTAIKSKFEVPVGYQDESGFHHGKQPAHKKSEWPPVW
jgi:hypothetical protein